MGSCMSSNYKSFDKYDMYGLSRPKPIIENETDNFNFKNLNQIIPTTTETKKEKNDEEDDGEKKKGKKDDDEKEKEKTEKVEGVKKKVVKKNKSAKGGGSKPKEGIEKDAFGGGELKDDIKKKVIFEYAEYGAGTKHAVGLTTHDHPEHHIRYEGIDDGHVERGIDKQLHGKSKRVKIKKMKNPKLDHLREQDQLEANISKELAILANHAEMRSKHHKSHGGREIDDNFYEVKEDSKMYLGEKKIIGRNPKSIRLADRHRCFRGSPDCKEPEHNDPRINAEYYGGDYGIHSENNHGKRMKLKTLKSKGKKKLGEDNTEAEPEIIYVDSHAGELVDEYHHDQHSHPNQDWADNLEKPENLNIQLMGNRMMPNGQFVDGTLTTNTLHMAIGGNRASSFLSNAMQLDEEEIRRREDEEKEQLKELEEMRRRIHLRGRGAEFGDGVMELVSSNEEEEDGDDDDDDDESDEEELDVVEGEEEEEEEESEDEYEDDDDEDDDEEFISENEYELDGQDNIKLSESEYASDSSVMLPPASVENTPVHTETESSSTTTSDLPSDNRTSVSEEEIPPELSENEDDKEKSKY